MGSEDELQKRVAHKLQKKRPQSRPRLNIPDRFKDGEDAQEDVTAPRHTQHMNQSVFSMVAAAGSKVDFHSRFDDDSSESEDETSPTAPPTGHGNGGLPAGKASSAQQRPPVLGHPRKVTEHELPALDVRTMKERKYMSQSFRKNSPEEQSPKGGKTPRESPVMSQMLQARAAMNSSNIIAAGIQEHEQSDAHVEATDLSALSKQLMEIFDFEKPEDVISEYPCWLLQSVLLQGYMYITTKHICFYAYLPKKSNIVAKSGHLTKRGRQNPTYHRYWFTLKGDVLSYYQSASDLYFPSGNIDLRYGIQASQKGKDSKDFSVTTNQRTYWFKADSIASAKEWVKTLQKVIFRSHNEGDSVKISLPIENIIDIEDSPVLDFAETFKIRVFDSDETFAIDEYFFSFFSFGTDALNVLRSMIDDTPAQRLSIDLLRPTNQSPRSQGSRDNGQHFDAYKDSPRGATTPVLHDNVRATLSPIPSGPNSGRASPRLSCDIGGRASQELNRRSFDLSTLEPGRRSMSQSRKSSSKGRRDNRSPFLKPRGSTDSFDHSLDREHDSSAGVLSSNDTIASASQILDRSDVFKSPTIQETQPYSSRRPAVREGHSLLNKPEDNQHFGATDANFKVLPPSRSQARKPSTKHRGHTNLDGNSESGSNRGELQHSNSSPSLQNLVRVGAYPLQRAAGWAGLLTKRSKRMSSLLATESMGYIEKVSGMWQGGRKHYEEAAELHADDRLDDAEDDEDVLEHGARFRNHFALPESERLQATYFGHLHRVLPLYGKIYISNKSFCFRSLLPGTKTKMILPLKDIENVDKEKGFRWGYSGLVIVIKGHEELFFEYSAPDTRDDCAITLLQNIERVKYMKESGMLTREEKESVEAAKSEHKALQEARRKGHDEHELSLPKASETAGDNQGPPIMFDDPRASIINFKPTESLRITCLTIGSRGDVQPYIALCKGLLAEGHKPKIATHAEFEPWVRKHGIQFEPVFGDPAELMRICVENGMFTYSFLREASTKFRGWMDGLLTSAWKACQDTDILIESPSAMAGIHIAEALEIPFFRAFTMPWTRTRAYPHAFAVPTSKKGGAYNYLSYVMFDNVFWKAQAGQVNRWRKKELNLPSTGLDKLQPNKVPFMYNFSPSVVVPPIDYSDWIRVTGYWFLDEATNWEPPKDMVDFIKQARTDKKKIVYIGFGSITVSDPAALTKTIVDSVLKADVRCILSKGWSDRFEDKDAMKTEIPLPKEIHQIKSAPHDWLFKQVDAAAHHGGAGTTGASLRAGLPTIIKPFFGDQFFYGSRVEDLGVGICIKKLNISVFSRALWEAVNDERIIVKAKVLGENIRSEDGVGNAIQSIYRDLEYAKSLIKKRGAAADDGVEDSEESWTFIGDEGDAELVQRIADWSPMVQTGEDGTRLLGKKKSIRRTDPEMHV